MKHCGTLDRQASSWAEHIRLLFLSLSHFLLAAHVLRCLIACMRSAWDSILQVFAPKPEVAQEQGHNSIYHADLKPEAVDQLTIDMRKRQIEIYLYIYILYWYMFKYIFIYYWYIYIYMFINIYCINLYIYIVYIYIYIYRYVY